MNRSANAVDGPLSASLKLSEQPDGSYVCQPVGQMGQVIGPISGRTASEATNLCKQALQKAAAEGKI